MAHYNVFNPSPQDLEDAIKERHEKEDYYYKALAEAQEKLYHMMVENSQEEIIIKPHEQKLL